MADVRAHAATIVRQIADALNSRDILTPRGGGHPTSVVRLLERIGYESIQPLRTSMTLPLVG